MTGHYEGEGRQAALRAAQSRANTNRFSLPRPSLPCILLAVDFVRLRRSAKIS